MTFQPKRYFDLDLFKHNQLFEKTSFVWEALLHLKEYFSAISLSAINSPIPESVTLVNPEQIHIGEGSVIEAQCYIEGPCYIGKNCHIAHGAYIRPYSLICDHAKVGHSTEIKHSVMFPHSKAPHFNYVGDSILGHNVNLGAGVILANYKLNGSPVSVKSESKVYNTNVTKFGAVIGDGCSIGCNSVTNPGTLIDRGYKCMPLSLLTGIIESHTKTLLS